MNKILGLLLLLSSPAYSEEAFFSYGTGVFHNAKNSPIETKVINGGYRESIYEGFYWQAKLGYWGDGSGDPTRTSSLYGSTGLGLEVNLSPIELRSGWGIGGISSRDSYLGGRFPQFNGELYFGGRDRRGNGIGLKYEHISSAGIVMPNIGRDFLTLELSQRW